MAKQRGPSHRIYGDESGTHSQEWLIIGMLFVPDHGQLHSELCRVKEGKRYFNKSPRRRARYKETHLADFHYQRDVEVAKAWVDKFATGSSYFRSIVIDWSMWQGKYFGVPFEPDALKKRRAYKKWAEMLLHPEVKAFQGAILYLDRLLILHGYDVLDHLRDRFTRGYEGTTPWIKEFQFVDSWKDAHQCLQLCDLLVGSIYQTLVPSTNALKLEASEYVYEKMKSFGVNGRGPKYWRGFHKSTLNRHHPKFSEWYWQPD